MTVLNFNLVGFFYFALFVLHTYAYYLLKGKSFELLMCRSYRSTCRLSSIRQQIGVQDEHQAPIFIMLHDRLDRYADHHRGAKSVPPSERLRHQSI